MCLEHISILFDVGIPLWMAEWCIPFWVTFIYNDFDILRENAEFDLYLLLELKFGGNMIIWVEFITKSKKKSIVFFLL